MSKIVHSLIETIDNDEHNDGIILLEDGEISVNKLLISVQSDYFRSKFSKKSSFKEHKKSSVKISTKKNIMKQIIIYLYGGKVDISNLTCVEMIELLRMLNLLLLNDGYKEIENEAVRNLQNQVYSLQNCFELLEITSVNNFDRIKYYAIANLSINMDLVNDNHQENIIKMSAETIMDVLVHIYNIERKCPRPFPPHQQMKKFEFIFKWLQKNMFSIKEETKQRILSYINHVI